MRAPRFNPKRDYAADGATLNAIAAVVSRLYDASKPLSGDERRDLANRMDALLGHFAELES